MIPNVGRTMLRVRIWVWFQDLAGDTVAGSSLSVRLKLDFSRKQTDEGAEEYT